MRNILLLFLLLILMFSVISLFWKSILDAKNNKNDEKQPTRVEKLVKGENNNDVEYENRNILEKYIEPEIPPEDRRFSQKRMEPPEERFELQENSRTINKPEKNQQLENIMQNYENIDLKQISPENIQVINEELIKKYGNNPNAEVSEEDLQKIIEQIIQPQNR